PQRGVANTAVMALTCPVSGKDQGPHYGQYVISAKPWECWTAYENSMPIIKPLLMALFIIGALLSLYIPLIPFLTWFSGLVAWSSSVFEGLIAAQLWAMNHITTDGEGLGPRTERGYGYLINMLLRPLLMVLGFFLASGLAIGLGTLFLQMWGAAIANVQGNSATGLASIVGLVVIFSISVIVLVQSIFNLIHELPDRVLGWLGTGLDARFGRELDHEIKQSATTAIRWSGTVVR
ncbi:MAG: DotA/TraY family protein, partial [Pigmentiphaga sp.]